jgi:hypothetical protein
VGAAAAQNLPSVKIVSLGNPVRFATHAELQRYGFSFGLRTVSSTRPIGPPVQEPGRTLYYPTLVGETGDPTVGGPAPRVYFSGFPIGQFPKYKTSVFESAVPR